MVQFRAGPAAAAAGAMTSQRKIPWKRKFEYRHLVEGGKQMKFYLLRFWSRTRGEGVNGEIVGIIDYLMLRLFVEG